MDEINKRVKYNKSPLAEVIFQLRYPTILSINASDPVLFQERIRTRFPFYRKIVNNNEIEINGVKQFLGKEINYEFISQDKGTKINLTSSFIAISSRKYERWELFRSIAEDVRAVFEDLYHPQFYVRVGLRYQDVIDREVLGLEDKGWVDLIRPHILGTINEKNQDSLKKWIVSYEFSDAESNVQTKQLFQLSQKVGGKERVMIFDCDYFMMGNLPVDSVENISNLLHDSSSTFIRGAITLELHNAMDPVKL